MFHFVGPMHEQKMCSNGPWIVHNSLLTMQSNTRDFTMSDEATTEVPMYVEFLGPPIPL